MRRIRRLLAGYDGPEPDRVRAAIELLADGDEAQARSLLETARVDFRDVLSWAQLRQTGDAPSITAERAAELERELGRPAPPVAGGLADVVLTDAGSRAPGLLQAVRAQTGLGLAAVDALLDDLPARVAAGLSPADAAALVRALEAAGGAAEVR